MGSFLSKLLGLRAPLVHRAHGILQPLPGAPVRPSSEPAPRDHPPGANLLVFPPPRRLAIRQARSCSPGVLPAGCCNGDQKTAAGRPRYSLTLRIPSLDKRRVLQQFLNSALESASRSGEGRCVQEAVRSSKEGNKKSTGEANHRVSLHGQSIRSTLAAPSNNIPDPCVQGTSDSALEDEERDVVKEDRLLPVCQEEKRRRLDAAVKGQSAFKALLVHGVPDEFLPKPGSLKRCLSSLDTRGIPTPRQDVITSSCSSTQGLLPLKTRSDPTAPHCSSPASSCSQLCNRSGKKTGEDLEGNSALAPLVTDDSQEGKAWATATGTQQDSLASPPSPGSSAVSRRKVPLLLPREDSNRPCPLDSSLVTPYVLRTSKSKSFPRDDQQVLEDRADAASNSV